MDWKWLFIYPDEGVATVNHLVVPLGRPLHFSITSATVMNSLLIPRLGSQIYAMAGMVTQLNLKADRAGTYRGLSAQFSGEGFADMVFDLQSVPPDQYKSWTDQTRGNDDTLDEAAYSRLLANRASASPQMFGKVQQGLFDRIVEQSGGSAHSADQHGSSLPAAMEMR